MRFVVLLAFAALALRLVDVQGLSAGRYAAIGRGEVSTTQSVEALRGGIYDRDGAVLALSVRKTDVVADPLLVRDPGSVAAALSPLLGVGEDVLLPKLVAHSGYEVLALKVDASTAAAVTALHIDGISELPDTDRLDPDGTLGGPVVGTVHADGSGASGLEAQFQRTLAGVGGSAIEEVSPGGIALPGTLRQVQAARPGTGIELTIDSALQYVTEQALGAEISASKAKSGIAIVMDSRTGEILAMANLVADPQGRSQVNEAPGDAALTQVYEPGSVFKLVTFSAALADGVITPDENFTVPNDVVIDGSTFHDAESHPTEVLSATQILAQSSNIGTIEIAQQLGAQRLSSQIAALGFGEPTGLGFPGESPGIVLRTSHWEPTDMASTPIGQDDAVSAQQVLDMVNTVATGGVFITPHLLRATVGADGTVRPATRSAGRRVFSPEVANELTGMMEQVVQDGTAVSAGIPGYTVAGKTGTAQIPDPSHRGYIPGAYMATFAGFAPAENPQLSAIVVLQQPTPIFGGETAAPAFAQIMRYALHRYGVPVSPAVAGLGGGTAQAVAYAPGTVSGSPTGGASQSSGPGTQSGSTGSAGSPGTIATGDGTSTGSP